MKYLYTVFAFIIFSSLIFAQSNDSVDVTFYYHPDNNSSTVYLPGEFNGWTVNNSTLMSEDPATGIWSKTVRLRVGGPVPLPSSNSISGAYQYKFYDDGRWLEDPLNPRNNLQDNNNSYLFIRNPTIHYLLPNSTLASGIIRTRFRNNAGPVIYPRSISRSMQTGTRFLRLKQPLNCTGVYAPGTEN